MGEGRGEGLLIHQVNFPAASRWKPSDSRVFQNLQPHPVSPDSAWLATAISGLKKRGSIWPQLFHGSAGWSQTVESPSRKTVGTSAFSISNFAMHGFAPLNSSVSFSSQSQISVVVSRVLRCT